MKLVKTRQIKSVRGTSHAGNYSPGERPDPLKDWRFSTIQLHFPVRHTLLCGEVEAAVIEPRRMNDEDNEKVLRLIAAAPAMLDALKYAEDLIRTARRYFPKSIRNSDKFNLENTNAAIVSAISLATIPPDERAANVVAKSPAMVKDAAGNARAMSGLDDHGD